MRRMITKNGVIDAVNEGIESGEIEVGGLPEIEEGDAGKVLTVSANESGAEWATASAGGVTNFKNINGTTGTIISSNVTSINGVSADNFILSNTTYDGGNIILTQYASAKIPVPTQSGLQNSIILETPYYGDVPGAFPGLRQSLANGTALSAFRGSSASHSNTFYSCLLLVQNAPASYTNKLIKGVGSIIVSNDLRYYDNNNGYGEVFGTAIFGGYHELKFTQNGGGLNYALIAGREHQIIWTSDNRVGKAIVGKYGILDGTSTNTDQFMVGAGTSTSNRLNCFATGRTDSGDSYIKIGSTTLTEAQLQALLATLS